MISELNIFKAFTFSQIDQKTAVSIKITDPTITKIELKDFEKLESLDLTEIKQNILLKIENCPKLSFVNLPFIQENHQVEYKCRSISQKDEYQCIIRGNMISFLFQMVDQEKILAEDMVCATSEKALKHVLIGDIAFLKKIHQSCDDFSIYCLQNYQSQDSQDNQKEQSYTLDLKTQHLMLMTDFQHLLFPNQIDTMTLYLKNCQKITYDDFCHTIKIKDNQSLSQIDFQLKNLYFLSEIQDKQDAYQILLDSEIEKQREYEFTQEQIQHFRSTHRSYDWRYDYIDDDQLTSEQNIQELKENFKKKTETQIKILNERKYEIRSKMGFLKLFQKIELINCQLDHLEINAKSIPVQISLFHSKVNQLKSQFLKSAYANETSEILSFDLNQTNLNFSYHVDQKNPTLVDLKGSLFENENSKKYFSRYHLFFDLTQEDAISQMLQLFEKMTEEQKSNHLYSIGRITESPTTLLKNLKFLYMLDKTHAQTYAKEIWDARMRAMTYFKNGEKKDMWIWFVPKEDLAEAYLVDLHLVLRLYHICDPAKAWLDEYLHTFVLPIQISTLSEILLPIEQEDGSATIFEPLQLNSQALYHDILNHIFYILECSRIKYTHHSMPFTCKIENGELISDGKIDAFYLEIDSSKIMLIPTEIDPKYKIKKKEQFKKKISIANEPNVPDFECHLNLIVNQLEKKTLSKYRYEMGQNEEYEEILAYTQQCQYGIADFQKDLYHMTFNLYDLVCELKLNYPIIQNSKSTFLDRLEQGLVRYLLLWPLDVHMLRNGPLELLHTLGSRYLDQMLWEIFNMSPEEFYHRNLNDLLRKHHFIDAENLPELHNLRKELILELQIKPTQNLFFNQKTEMI